jgi:hypothetical protein
MNNKLHAPLARQRGMTMLSWAVVIAFLLFQGIMAMKIVPVYLSDSSVSTIMKNLSDDASLKEASSAKIREVITKRLKINNIYNITKDDIKIQRAQGGYLVTIEYEPRGKLVGNLEFIISFKHEALIASRAQE